MNKYLKYSLFGLGGLLLLLIIAVAVIAATFNPNDYKPMIVKLVQDKKQRTLTIDGDIKLAFWPKIGADLGKVALSEHNSDKPFAAINSAKVSLALLPLLKKELVVDTIYVDGATANIVRHKDGSTNFDDLMSKDEEESQQIKFDVDGVNITDSSLTFTDEQAAADGKTDVKYSVSKFNLKTGHVALAQPFDLATDFVLVASQPAVNAKAKIKGNFMADPDAKHYVVKGLDANISGDVATLTQADITLAGDVDAKPDTMELLVDSLKLALKGELDGASITVDVAAPKLVVEKNQVSGKEAKINLSQKKAGDTFSAKLVLADIEGSPSAIKSSGISGELAAEQGKREVQGSFSSPFTGNLDKMVFDLPSLAGKLDIKDPALPNGGAKGSFALKLHADVKQEQASSDFNLTVDDTRLKGDVALAGFSKPNIKFNVSGDQLDLNKLLGNKTAAAESKAKRDASAQAGKPADLSALKELLLQGTVNIGSILYDKYRLSGLKLAVKADGQQLNVSPFAVKFDDTNIKGSLGISRYAKPIYAFDLDVDKLDADKYITKSDAPPAKPADSSKPAADTPIDLSALKQINAAGELRIGWLKLANVKSTNVRIKLQADDGVAQLAPFSANLYEGAMNGTLKVDARATPSIAFKQSMSNIAIGPLLVDAINNDMLSGKGTLNLDVTTQGATVGALKKALGGTAAVNLADGAVKGIDIAGTLRGVKDKINVLKSQQTKVDGDKSKKTDFSEMVASFTIKNGVAHNQDLSMKAPLFRITGNGDIDIANEGLNYLAKPTVVNSLKGQGGAGLDELSGLTIPIRLTGTFSKPSYAIDFATLATALAQKNLLDKVGGSKGEAVKGLLNGNKEDALKSLLGGSKKQPPAEGGTAVPAPAPEQKPESSEDKAKKKLNKLLGL